MKHSVCFLLILAFILPIYSCSSSTAKTNKDSVSKNQNNSITIDRFDVEFHDYLLNPTEEKENLLRDKYPVFLKAFSSVVVNNTDTDINNSTYFVPLKEYFSNKTLSYIYDYSLNKFADIKHYEEDLTAANILADKKIGKQLPSLNMYVSGFKANTIVTDSTISISIDKYLGDFPLYENFFESYQRQQMQPKYVTRDFLKAWLLTESPISNKRKDLLSEVVNEGKVLYALSQLLPEWSEADILGYTDEQLKWSTDNSKRIWKTTLDQNNLFSTDFLIITKYMDEAPYTASISTDSPGRLGAWLGLQIVKAYAKNTNASLEKIFRETDYQKILKLAKYNP